MSTSRVHFIPNTLTFCNGASGIGSIYAAFHGYFGIASLLLLLALFFDGIDGYVAKKLHATTKIGEFLDSFCDIISFAIAPWIFAVLLFGATPVLLFCGIVFILSGAFRLARYHMSKSDGFIGMPITMNGLLFPLWYVLGVGVVGFYGLFVVSSMLMISTVKFKRIW